MTRCASVPFRAFDHVQLAMPVGEEERARAFYGGLLEMVEIRKPALLRARGGAWFQSGAVALHLGVDQHFTPARKAHPGLRCVDYARLRARLESAGCTLTDAEALDDGSPHCYVDDPFGNRLELIGAALP